LREDHIASPAAQHHEYAAGIGIAFADHDAGLAVYGA
jgi:hypothetical protein